MRDFKLETRISRLEKLLSRKNEYHVEISDAEKKAMAACRDALNAIQSAIKACDIDLEYQWTDINWHGVIRDLEKAESYLTNGNEFPLI